jgi:hypothetical protein
MKSSNLAWRIDWLDEHPEAQPVDSAVPLVRSMVDMSRADLQECVRPCPRFERRTIEIRDQGFAPFRIR